MAGLLFWKKKCFQIGFEGVQRGFFWRRCRKSFHLERPETEKALELTVESLWYDKSGG